MEARLTGTTIARLECILQPNEVHHPEAGELSWMTQFHPGGRRKRRWAEAAVLRAAFRRSRGRRQPVNDEYRRHRRYGEIALRPRFRGHILPVELGQGREYLILAKVTSAPRQGPTRVGFATDACVGWCSKKLHEVGGPRFTEGSGSVLGRGPTEGHTATPFSDGPFPASSGSFSVASAYIARHATLPDQKDQNGRMCSGYFARNKDPISVAPRLSFC